MRSSTGLLAVLILLCAGALRAQQQPRRNDAPGVKTLSWTAPKQLRMSETETRSFLHFEGADYDASRAFQPYYFERRPVSAGTVSVNVTLGSAEYEELDAASVAVLGNAAQSLPETPLVETIITESRKEYFAQIKVFPLRRNTLTGKAEKLVRFSLNVQPNGRAVRSNSVARTYAGASVLATGTWYRIGVAKTGVVKLDRNFFENTMGIDMSTLDPRNIRLYGNGRGMLSFENDKAHFDDLKEYAIMVSGEADGVFDQSDYVLFYGHSPHVWQYDSTDSRYHHRVHNYTDTTYYFINTDLGAGKRITPQGSSTQTVTHTVNTFDDYQYHEEDLENLIKSGREWYGEKFDILTNYSFNFNFPNIDVGTQAYVKTDLISRDGVSNIYNVNVQSLPQTGSALLSVPSVPVSCYYCDYAAGAAAILSMFPGSSNLLVSITKQTPSAIGWLNYIEVNVRRQLQMVTGHQLHFRDKLSTDTGNVAQYNLGGASGNTVVWDVSDPANVRLQQGSLIGSTFSFVLPADSMKEFTAFDGLSFNSATYFGQTANQNLHGMDFADYIIVAHPKFLSDANDLAVLHQQNDNLRSIVVTPQQIYNEFSSGAQDVTAIRDFVKMFYDRAQNRADLPRYLLLYGDGSYDNKHRLPGNTNYVPTFHNANSVAPTESYVSDEFFALLGDNEGRWDSGGDGGDPDVGVGRFPVQTSDQSKAIINKIRKYISKQPPSTSVSACSEDDCSPFGDWRTWVSFVGDDEDANVHTSQSDQLATMIDTTYHQYNIDKIYLDAYQEEHTPGGDRYPAVNEAVTRRVEKGSLIVNYTGHGGEVGLAHERVIEVPQINSWKNFCNLPLFVTATCEFSRYDDPSRTSAGEYVLLNPDGGGIALLTTVRLVYSTPNFNLNKKFYQCAFEPLHGEMPRIGDVYRITKVTSGNNTNNRNFTLLGDPALRLAYPVHDVKTTEVNNVPVNVSVPDTARALSLITVKGFVADASGAKITSYNGVVYPTVFDKATSITTLSNNGTTLSPPFTFKLQKNVLYKGKVSVTNGDFSFTFVVPKDIAYQFGPGRISYYADNGDQDAAGWYENIVVGGSNLNAPTDNVGPTVRLFLNDSNFVSGGVTNESPKLYALVSDSNGVNTVGNGIGHDVVSVLDDASDDAIVLNDYYVSDMNSYRSGKIIYPFTDLAEGTHRVSLKVWDVYNNSTTAHTEFVVARSAELALDHVLNYPNPFTTHTQFFFGHNRCCEEFDVQVQVFTVSGKLVKTLEDHVYMEGFRSSPIDWDGKDDFGDKIGKGVYVYRLKVRSADGKSAQKFEKLVILN